MSGGKDSSYALYLMVKRFNMRPLACTYDNGMLTDLARSNIRNAIDNLGVDHIMVAPDKTELKMMYRHFFMATKNICTVCNQGINAAICKTAVQEGIPLIILGGVGKLECAPIYGNKRYCMEDIFVSVMGKGFPTGVYHNYRTKQICSNHKIVPVTIYNHVNYDYASVLATVKAELGWHDAPSGQEKIDCLYHHAISALKFRQNGVTSTMLMASALLRDKQVSINQYRERIENEERRRDEEGKNEIKKLLDYLELDEAILNKQVHITDFVEPVLTDAAEETLRQELACPTLSLKKKVHRCLDFIQPEIQRDGGSVALEKISGSTVIIKIQGACKGCFQADDTLRNAIESILTNFIPEITSVETSIDPAVVFS
jgi:Fe-S cluster biogenesis protein NfuA